jgi:polysaccharide chain length determinant protein (PEP-CTERM system associated)
MLGHRDLGFDDYLAILRRRKWVIIIPVILGPALAYAIAVKLPSRYTSQTLLLVEQQKVPDAVVKPVVTDELAVRLSTMEELILSRTRLQPLIEKYGLYRGDTGKVPMEELVDRMRNAIAVNPVKSVVSSGREGELPGFYVRFTADDPRVAQQVCAEVTSMFVEENLRVREQSAQGTSSFLDAQIADAKRKLDEQDARLAEFKRKNLGALPDATQANLNLLTTLNTQFEAATQGLNRAQQDKAYIESLLAQQVAGWQASRGGTGPRPEADQQRLEAMENELQALEARYTSDHPDVLKLKSSIEQLRRKISETAAVGKDKPAENVQQAAGAEPPQILQLRSQVHAYEEAIRQYTREQNRLKEQIRLYQSRIQLSPVVEQDFKLLTRDYQTALDFYNELSRKRNQSGMATDLERRQQGQQFRVMDPANLPEEPSFPNRPLFAGGGLGIGLGLGLGITLLLEFLDKSIRTESDVEFYLKVPTLALVPTVGGGNGRGVRFWKRGKKDRERERPKQNVEA